MAHARSYPPHVVRHSGYVHRRHWSGRSRHEVRLMPSRHRRERHDCDNHNCEFTHSPRIRRKSCWECDALHRVDFPSGRDRVSVGLMMCADGAYRPLTGILAPPQFSRSASVAVPPTSVCRAPVTTCAPFKCKPIRSNSDSGHHANCEGPRDHDPRRVRTSPDRACRQRRESSATERPVRWRAFGWTKCTACESLSEATMGNGPSRPSNSHRRGEMVQQRKGQAR